LVIGCSLLLAAIMFTSLRVFLLRSYNVLTFAALTTVALTLLPDRRYVFAPLLALAILISLFAINYIKIRAVGLPISYLDFVIFFKNPISIFSAIGVKGNVLGFGIAASLVIVIAIVVLIFRAVRLHDGRRVIRWIAEFSAVLGLAVLACEAAARDLHSNTERIFPGFAIELWRPDKQQKLLQKVGPLIYVGLTRLEGDDTSILSDDTPAPPRPMSEILASAESYVQFPPVAEPQYPNIVIFHAESTFDPNAIFRLTEPVPLRIWSPQADTRALGPLRVNVIGGGSWVTEFEVLTGIDSRPFGYLGYYTHMTLGAKAKGGFPQYLRDRGYRAFAYYTAWPNFIDAGVAFRNYGFEQFIGVDELGLSGEWLETDVDVVNRVERNGAFADRNGPTFLYISSQENHGPHLCKNFDSADQFATRFEDSPDFDLNCSLNEYIRRAHSTSAAVDIITKELKNLEERTGRPFVLMVYGDHQPFSFTDGISSVPGGHALNTAQDRYHSVSRMRRGPNQNITFYHLRSSQAGVLKAQFKEPLPTTLMPTLLSAYVARGADDLYRPENFWAYRECGTDSGSGACPHAAALAKWGRDDLLGRKALPLPRSPTHADQPGKQALLADVRAQRVR
jgi:hypothetical protein